MRRSRSTELLLAITAILAFSATAPASARTTGQRVRKQLDQVVTTVGKLGVPGGVVGVTGGAVRHYARAFGIAGPGARVGLNDHFRIGSVTKTFTATVTWSW